MSWFILLLAGALEVIWAVGLKYTNGFTKPLPTIATGVALIGSTILLGMAIRCLPISTAYTIWTGIGAVGTAIAGIVLFNESANAMRIACIALIIVGVVGLKFVGHTE